jgi:hypothetical protein
MAVASLGTISTFHANVETLVGKRLDEAIATQKETICAGMLDHDSYKKEAGKLMGLRDAKTILEKAIADVMKG